VDGILVIPLIVDNPLNTAIDTTFSVKAPDGWKVNAVARASIAPHTQFYLRVLAVAPPSKLPGWQELTVSAESQSKTIGTVPIRAELSDGWVAPQ
jgi:hypothetical protein